MIAVTIPQTRPPREHVSARLWWLATAPNRWEDIAGVELAGLPGDCKHNYLPTRDTNGNRIWVCSRCGHTKR